MILFKTDIFAIAEKSKKELFKIKKITQKMAMKNFIIINIACLNSFSKEIKDLMKNPDEEKPKIFYGGSEDNFNDMKSAFGLLGRNDIFYAGNHFEIHEMYKIYWNFRFKLFPPLLSKSEEV